MLQDIYPHQFNNEFQLKSPQDNDFLIVFNNNEILMDHSQNELNFTTVKQIKNIDSNITENVIYLFSFDNSSFFCTFSQIKETENLKYLKTSISRDILPEWMTFVAATASHLAYWYETNRFCGRCGELMTSSKKERALCCEKCGLIKYPNISPAIIVAITDKDKILLTRYSDRPYKKLSLVAGFVEIGETLEDTIKREVKEEVGLEVKNIKYYKSQPWAFSQSLLMGFFAELDGSPIVKLDETELSEANWYEKEEIPPCDTTLSLTNTMIEDFRKNKISVAIDC